ncbi:MAG: MarR family transcriptional regulator, partial [Spirochaetia bacterium]|nr:MarR family transcriptional regulator [Spirochaetia bacterium]
MSKIRTREIAEEISMLMPSIVRNILFRSVDKENITQAQLFTLFSIREHEDVCKLRELSRVLQVTPPTVTGIVDRLERLKYVKRLPDKKDRRVIFVVLTQKGK